MQLVDTNVIAYLLIAGDRTAQAQALWQTDRDWRSESFYRIEFSNLLATHMRAKALTLAEAISLLDRAASLVPTLIDTAHADALRVAASHGVSAYDARFLAAAQTLGIKLVTEDSRLRKAAPRLTQSLAQALMA
jgi:predicted nucleic acid-binding protein